MPAAKRHTAETGHHFYVIYKVARHQDFATKYVSKDKEDASVAYICNSRSRAAHGDAIEEVSACVVRFVVDARA